LSQAFPVAVKCLL